MIKQFLREYLTWVEHGAAVGNPKFDRCYGLCVNMILFSCAKGLSHEERVKLGNDLKDMFIADGLSSIIPFNDNISEYNKESLAGLCHLNELRIAWARKHSA